MSYIIMLTQEAEIDIDAHKKSGNKAVLKKIDKIINELREHPTTGTGKPERLKHYQIPTWSRRITDKHRLVYRIDDKIVTVIVLSFLGHYEDK